FGSGEGRVDVASGRLDAGGDGVVGQAAPRRHGHVEPRVDVAVFAQLDGVAAEAAFHALEAGSEGMLALVAQGTDVDTLAEPAAPDHLDADLGDLLPILGNLHVHDVEVPHQPIHMLLEPEDQDVVFFAGVISADPFEKARAVVEGVGKDADLGVFDGDVIPVEVRDRPRLHFNGHMYVSRVRMHGLGSHRPPRFVRASITCGAPQSALPAYTAPYEHS